MADIKDMLAQVMNTEPVLTKSDIRAIVIANISNTMAVNAQKGRTLFMSSIAKDVVAAQGMAAGGIDINSLLLMNMMEEKKAEVKQLPEASLSDIAEGMKAIVRRLEVIEAEFVEQPEHKEVGQYSHFQVVLYAVVLERRVIDVNGAH